MSLDSRQRSYHWRDVALQFGTDFFFTWICFGLGVWARFGELSWIKLMEYGPSVAVASFVLPTLLYIGGLYSSGRFEEGIVHHLRWLSIGLGGALIVLLSIGSIDFSSRVGRGVLLIGFGSLAILVVVRHFLALRVRKRRWRRVICLLSGEADEAAAVLLNHLWGRQVRRLEVLQANGYRSRSELTVAGDLDDFMIQKQQGEIDMILVRDQHLVDPAMGPALRLARYQGIEIVSLADACEEAYHAVPLGLVTNNWLFRASSQAGLFYIKKLKRLFDILAATAVLVFLAPFLALGAALVRLSSPGPVLFRQVRAGRLGRPFTVVKLRTMHETTEEEGERWCASNDPRIFLLGKWLRRFRVDEIPQLINVIRGDMSFVGPRPEQVSLVELLDAEVPFYKERLLVQPGLTGWAQVQYPYGSSVDDAARKLEYDLYYMKHMSLFLDFFILIETAKTMLLGGVRPDSNLAYADFRRDIAKLTADSQDAEGEPISKTRATQN